MRHPNPHLQPENPAEAAYKHDRALLRALYTCQQVMVAGQMRLLHSIHPQVLGGGIDTTVYLMGDPTPYAPADITFPEQPE